MELYATFSRLPVKLRCEKRVANSYPIDPRRSQDNARSWNYS